MPIVILKAAPCDLATLANEFTDLEHQAHVAPISKLVPELRNDFFHNDVNCVWVSFAHCCNTLQTDWLYIVKSFVD